MARSQLEPPLEPLEKLLEKANAQTLNTPAPTHSAPVDINNPVALKALAMSRLEEIVRTAPANVSLVGAIRELIDRIEGKAPQSIQMDVSDKRLDKAPIDDLLRLAAMMREPMVIAPMPKKPIEQ